MVLPLRGTVSFGTVAVMACIGGVLLAVEANALEGHKHNGGHGESNVHNHDHDHDHDDQHSQEAHAHKDGDVHEDHGHDHGHDDHDHGHKGGAVHHDDGHNHGHDDHHHGHHDHGHDDHDHQHGHEDHGHEHGKSCGHNHGHDGHEHGQSFLAELQEAFEDSMPWLMLGLVVSGLFGAMMPSQGTVASLLGSGGVAGSLRGAAVGVCVPLCSCGALPVAVSLSDAGAAPQAVVAFVTAAQSAGVDSAFITWGILGAPVAIARLLSALVIAAAAGIAAPAGPAVTTVQNDVKERKGFLQRAYCGLRCALTETFDETAPWVAAGLTLTAAISVYAPKGDSWIAADVLVRLLILVATLPLQLCEHGTVSFASALRKAGASTGTAFAFLMSAPATNLATMALLTRRQPAGSVGVLRISVAVIVTSLALSYAFDASGISFELVVSGHDLPPWLARASLYFAAFLVAGSVYRKLSGNGAHEHHD